MIDSGVIVLQFDPALDLGDLAIRWQTIGVTAAVLLALIAVGASVTTYGWRLTELVLIVVGIVPGAVIGGRLVHGLAYLDFYAPDPVRLLDPSVGTLSLLGAVLGGLASATYVARHMGVAPRPWADAAAVPLLVAIGVGKFAQLLGGSGQGMPFDGPWAVAFAGEGPWVSAYPDLPSHPAQVYEGLWMLMGIPLLALWRRRRLGPERARPLDWEGWPGEGGLLVAALAWFLFGRVIVGFTWRDEALLGPLNVEQALALVALIVIVFVRLLRAGRRVVAART